ncbi:MAG: type II toxin-antitoxin system PemK/MazF family toxin [Microthrixaceae bacterium]
MSSGPIATRSVSAWSDPRHGDAWVGLLGRFRQASSRRGGVVTGSAGVDVCQAHVVPLTSNLERAGLAGNVLLESTVTGLSRDSVAVPLGLELVDRAWLGDRTGQLPQVLMDAIDEGVRAVLGL